MIENENRLVRPVDGAAWFDQPGIEAGVVHLIDDDNNVVAIVETSYFDRNAAAASWSDYATSVEDLEKGED